jgi:hypothetical protein
MYYSMCVFYINYYCMNKYMYIIYKYSCIKYIFLYMITHSTRIYLLCYVHYIFPLNSVI